MGEHDYVPGCCKEPPWSWHHNEYPPEPDGRNADQCVNCGYYYPDNSTHFMNCTEEGA